MLEKLIPGDVFYTGKTFNLFLTYAFQPERPQHLKTDIKLRPKDATSSANDILLGAIKTSAIHYNEFKQSEALYLACRSKEEIDKLEDYKKIAGCASAVGSVFCFMGTTATVGAAGILCEGVWSYAFDTGAADCVDLLKDTILADYADHPMMKAMETLNNIKDGDLKGLASDVLDTMCKDVKTNEGYIKPEPKTPESKNSEQQQNKPDKEFHGGLVVEKQDKEKPSTPEPKKPDKDPVTPDHEKNKTENNGGNNGGKGGGNNGKGGSGSGNGGKDGGGSIVGPGPLA